MLSFRIQFHCPRFGVLLHGPITTILFRAYIAWCPVPLALSNPALLAALPLIREALVAW